MEVFFEFLTPSEQEEIDFIVANMKNKVRPSEVPQFPRFLFTNGITNLSKLTAKERIGAILALSMVLLSAKGQRLVHIIESRVEKSSDSSRSGCVCKTTELLYLCEKLLCFYAWYKADVPFRILNCTAERECHLAIVHLLEKVKTTIPRNESNGWKLQKFHGMLHCARDISMWGAPGNYDASRGENFLIRFAKKPASRTSKKASTFLDQVTARLWEKSFISKAVALLPSSTTKSLRQQRETAELLCIGANEQGAPQNSRERTNDQDALSLLEGERSSKYRVVLNKKGDSWDTPPSIFVSATWSDSSRETLGPRVIHPVVLNWFRENTIHLKGETERQTEQQRIVVQCWTEFRVNGTLYRCHPNFRSEGEW